MIRLVLKVVVNAVALWAAAELVSGVRLSEDYTSILFVAVIFGLINAVIKPVAKVLAFPVTVLTLGLFALVVNAAMLGLTAWVTNNLEVDGFRPAILGALVIGVVSWVLSVFVPDD